jgi:prophage endopeptidase
VFTLFKLIPKPYLILGLVVVLAASHLGALMFGRNMANNAAKARLQKETQAKLVQMQTLMTENLRLSNEVRAKEAEHAEKLASFSQTYQEQLQNVRMEKDKFVAGVRAGTIRLRIPQPARPSSNNPALDQVNAGAGRCDASAESELPRDVAEFLYSEASRADAIVNQLQACQAIVIEDRRICGAK